jgi:tetratricopeptide (TPR) repeat protein
MTRRAWLAAAAGIFLVSSLFASQAIVVTNDGQTLQGEIEQRGGAVIVTIHGVQTVIPKNQIESITPVVDEDAELAQRLVRLDPNDVSSRLDLAHEAFEKGRYEVAREALREMLEIAPDNDDAKQLFDTVQSQIRMERNKNVAAKPTTMIHAAPSPNVDSRLLLSAADIQTIRRAELNPYDVSARIRFDGDVKKRFADSQKISFGSFNALSPAQQAMKIFSDGDASMRDKVQVLSDPQTVMDFRRVIQPLVLQNCATVGCHGATTGRKLILYQPADNDAITYTNYYILQRYAQKSSQNRGIFNSNQQRLIERGHGERSLLATYGLGAHPPINGKPVAPIFHNADDPRYKLLVQWIDAMPISEPNYGIVYPPPPATQPTTQMTR